MRKRKIKHVLLCLLAIVVALIWVFPIIYMIISSFKTETDVVVPGIIFSPTIENYRAVLSDTFFKYLGNSILITLGTVIITVLLAVPAGYGIVFTPLKNPNSVYFWFVSTTFLPAIAVIIPVYLIFQKAGLVDNPIALIILYCGYYPGIPDFSEGGTCRQSDSSDYSILRCRRAADDMARHKLFQRNSD